MKLGLNLSKPGNYAFFCPVSRLHLTLSDPIGFVNEITQPISRGLKTKVLIDLSDSESGQKKEKTPAETPKAEPKKEEVKEEPKKEETVETPAPAEEPKKEATEEKAAAPKKRGGRAKKTES